MSKNIFIHHVKEKGYGANLKDAIKKITSKYLIFFDCDGSYDPNEILNLYQLIVKENLDLVYGNRLKVQEKKSMPFLHRYLGTPVLSFFIRLFFKNNVYDCNSGMRIMKVSSYENINFYCNGMEFASEIFIKTSLNKLKMKEINIKFRKDYRSKPPHLSRWSDGWRHLRYILSCAPDFYIYSILATISICYLLIFLMSFYSVNDVFPRYHTIFGLLSIILFSKSLLAGVINLRTSLVIRENFTSKFIKKIFAYKQKNIFMKVFIIFFVFAFIDLIKVFYHWISIPNENIHEISSMIRILIFSSIGSFFMNLDLQIESRKNEY